MKNMTDVDRLILLTHSEHILDSLDALEIIYNTYPDIKSRLLEIQILMKEVIEFACDKIEPTLIPKNQQHTFN